MIFRRLPESSSFVLAAARLRALQLDSSAAAADPGHLRGRPRRIVKPAPGRQQHVVTGPDPYALLTTVALMGADVSEPSFPSFMPPSGCDALLESERVDYTLPVMAHGFARWMLGLRQICCYLARPRVG